MPMIEHLYREEGSMDDEALPYLYHAIVFLLPKLTNAVTWQRMEQKPENRWETADHSMPAKISYVDNAFLMF